MAGRIIVAGHICLDITPIFQSDRAQPLSQVLIPGKLVQMKDVNINTGGAVANTGLALKLLGADVELMGKVGDDEFGRIVLDRLRAYGVEEGSMIVSPDSGTSYSIVIAPPGTDRIFLHNPGANDTFRARDLDFAKIARADFFHFGYPPIMRHMYEDGGGGSWQRSFAGSKSWASPPPWIWRRWTRTRRRRGRTGRKFSKTSCPMWTTLSPARRSCASWPTGSGTRSGWPGRAAVM